MTIEQIISRTAAVLHDDLRHADYTRTVDVAKKAYRFATGVGLENDLTPFTLTETTEEFEIRKSITRLTVPAVIDKIMSPTNKIKRSGFQRNVAYNTEDNNDASVKILEGRMSEFWGDEGGLDNYVDTRYWELNKTDPNAWVVTEFEPFSPGSFAAPYPFEVMSSEAWDFLYEKMVLQFLTVYTPIQFVNSRGQSESGTKLTVYMKDETVVFEQVGVILGMAANDAPIILEDRIYTKNRTFAIVRSTPHSIGFVPAKRVGFVRDMVTNGRTFVTLFHVAYATIESGLKSKSELDLVTCFSAFPHRAEYVPPCEAEGCFKGNLSNGDTCHSCGGTGYKRVTSHQHVTRLPMPANFEEIFDLSKLRSFTGPDPNYILFMRDFWMYLEDKAIKDVYNSDVFQRDSIAATATEKSIEMQGVHDVLVNAASNCSIFWSHLVRTVAAFIGRDKGLTAEKRYSGMFIPRTALDIVSELTQLEMLGNTPFAKKSLLLELVGNLYYNDPASMLEYKLTQRIDPFAGESEALISQKLASTLVPEYQKTLYFMLPEVTRRVINEQGIEAAMSYTDEKLEGVLRAIVADIQSEVAQDRPIISVPAE